MGMYKDDNETEEDFNNPLLSKPGFPQRPSDREVSCCLASILSLAVSFFGIKVEV